MPDERVLVVGTTPDYIAYIDERFPGRALFLTDRSQREGAREAAPDRASEIVTDLSSPRGLRRALSRHLEKYAQTLSGVTCYDCEWLLLTAELASEYHLDYPSTRAIQLSRNKYLTKTTWREANISAPRVELVRTSTQASGLVDRFGGPVVLKPLTGSGSELTFKCESVGDSVAAFRDITEGLMERSDSPMYSDGTADTSDAAILAEKFAPGREYSADFIIENNRTRLIRVARKIRLDGFPFGTTSAYQVPARLPEAISEGRLRRTLREAALALGLERAVCMVDFMIHHDSLTLLEMTPRIGGDCLPPLVRHACGLDTIGLALDFAERKRISIPGRSRWTEMIGMRLFAVRAGLFAGMKYGRLLNNQRVREIYLKREAGQRILLPPDDYNSWILGHLIFEPDKSISIDKQCRDLRKKITIDVEHSHEQESPWTHDESCPSAQSPDTVA